MLRKNRTVVDLDKSRFPLAVNDVSAVAPNKVIDAILAKYPNKIVLVDLWATWCVPCLNAIQEFRAAKQEFIGKDVVFVYLTNGSSPRKLWEEKIQGIGSEHYYLNDSQWDYIMDEFDFEGIPSYLLYNKNGKLEDKFTAFPGNERVKSLINDVLRQ